MDKLYNAIAEIIETRRGEPSINAMWVAHEAMQKVDPDRISVPCVYGGCSEHAKQYARGLLRKKFNPVAPENPQHELFTKLQWRYPAARDDLRGERESRALELLENGDVKNLAEGRQQAASEMPSDDPSYLLRDKMSEEDVEYNVRHFRLASEALAKHADALQSWWDGRPRPQAA